MKIKNRIKNKFNKISMIKHKNLINYKIYIIIS